MSRTSERVIGLYGNVAIERTVCPKCSDWSLVLDGRTLCCDERLADTEPPEKFRRMSEPEFRRKIPRLKERQAILEEQGNRCFYCDRRFGSHVWRGLRRLVVRLAWDHLLPYSMTANNYAHNFVAACSICNGLKSNHVFHTIEEARIYVQAKAAEKGIGD